MTNYVVVDPIPLTNMVLSVMRVVGCVLLWVLCVVRHVLLYVVHPVAVLSDVLSVSC